MTQPSSSNTLLHPRPQLERSGWIDLCGEWEFAYDDEDVGRGAGWQDRPEVFDRRITVPFPPESRMSGVGDTSFHPVLWYRRTFRLLDSSRRSRTILNFGAVDYRATVWVNAEIVAEHEGGHTPFKADITDVLRETEQIVVVRVEDWPDDLAQPRGKQDWQERPHAIWYERTSGIWQPVWIEHVGDVCIDSLDWLGNVDEGSLTLHLRLDNEPENGCTYRVHLRLHGDICARAEGDANRSELDTSFDLAPRIARDPASVLWDPDSPNLIQAEIVLERTGEVLDEVRSYAGFRSVSTQGGAFRLNGKSCFLRLGLAQGYWPDSLLAAPSVEAMRHEVELAKELGFNGIRIHQKVEDPRFLYWCDRLGLLTFGEMASTFVFSAVATGRLSAEWSEVVKRDRSHPCVVAWVPLNESWGIPQVASAENERLFAQELCNLTKQLDPTRPVIGNDGWEHVCGDMIGIHDYDFSGQTLQERYGSRTHALQTIETYQPEGHPYALAPPRPGTPILLTEFGGIGFDADRSLPRWSGYGTVPNEVDFLAKYAELVDAVNTSSGLAGFCYTQLTDTGQEMNGLLTEYRQPKVDPVLIARINLGREARPTPTVSVANDPEDLVAS